MKNLQPNSENKQLLTTSERNYLCDRMLKEVPFFMRELPDGMSALFVVTFKLNKLVINSQQKEGRCPLTNE